MHILITGGAGYIGSILTEELLKEGHEVITIDDLQQGHKEAVPPNAEFICADICQKEDLEDIFRRFKIDAVVHMAAEASVEYSMTNPSQCFQNNICGGINLLDVMLQHNVDKIIFSSSAAIYGNPESVPIEESHSKNPINAYGESKLIFEHILYWYGKAYGLKHISLRYFNAAGASTKLGESHYPETHLIPNVLKAALDSNPVSVFGTDYPTKDGSCIRDYVHVIDIARAHSLALKKLGGLSGRAYNLGNEYGYSVMEVVEAANRVTGVNIPIERCPRRAGDPAVLVASSNRAKKELGWKPEFSSLGVIIESAWTWIQQHPNGYEQ